MNKRNYSLLDELLIGMDRRWQRLAAATVPVASRPSPATGMQEATLSEPDKRLAAGLMRVNHAGEVAAQGLYQGQAFVAQRQTTRQAMQKAAAEEADHLAWCAERVNALDSHCSYLNPVWYAGSFTIGSLAGLFGDRWSLGFIVETEYQVEAHLEEHLSRLPAADQKSRRVVEEIKKDEAHHAATARSSGGYELPAPVRQAMKICSGVMTRTAFWV